MRIEQMMKLAAECQSYLEEGTRPDGSKYIRQTRQAPKWFQDLCRKAHGDLLPDDWRYKFIAESLTQLKEYGGDREEACSWIEADTYNSDLLDWLRSNVNRASFVDEARGEYGPGDGVIDEIARGQQLEKIAVFHLVADFLEAKVESEVADNE